MRVLGYVTLPVLAAFVGATTIVVWADRSGAHDVSIRIPQDDRGAILQRGAKDIAATGRLTVGTGTASAITESWPAFRGADGRNIYSGVGLVRTLVPGGPRILWRRELGEGHAGAAIANGMAYVLDYDREGEADVMRAMSLDTGEDVWTFSYPVKIKRNHGMSRTVPAVNDKYVVGLGPKGHVVCLEALTGKFVWSIDLVGEYGTTVPPWYAGQCPLIDGDRAIIAPGGNTLMLAVELATGRRVFATDNPDGWQMTHASILAAKIAGRDQYVYPASRGVVGIDAESGALLWKSAAWYVSIANIPTPVLVGDDTLLFTGSYNAGAMLARLERPDGRFELRELARMRPDVFGSGQHTPIFYDGYVYSVIQNGELACLSVGGGLLWRSGEQARFGLGPSIVADGALWVLNDQKGTLHRIATGAGGFSEDFSVKVLDGHDAWAPIAVAGGLMILRDLTTMICIDLGA